MIKYGIRGNYGKDNRGFGFTRQLTLCPCPWGVKKFRNLLAFPSFPMRMGKKVTRKILRRNNKI